MSHQCRVNGGAHLPVRRDFTNCFDCGAPLAPKSLWIDVADRLPDDDGDELYLVRIDAGGTRINGKAAEGVDLARFLADGWWFDSLGDAPEPTLKVTHWMPLPEPPTNP